MDRFERPVQLAKASWNVLRGDKQLIWLPVLSGLTTLIVMVTIPGSVRPLTATKSPASAYMATASSGRVIRAL